MTRRLATFLIVFLSSICLAACNPPKPPDVLICVLDVPAQEGICKMSNQPGPVHRVPIAELDKSVSFPPESWEAFQNYLDEVKVFIEQNCKR